MHPMRGRRAVDLLLLPPALTVLLYQDGLRPALQRVVAALHDRTPLGRWRARVAGLPPAAALTLFLIPEACSRGGTLVSAWMLLHGSEWRALAAYAGAKLFAGSSAWWIYSACRPALLRLRAFAWLHGLVAALGRGLTRRRENGRFAAVLARLRAGWSASRGSALQAEVQH